MFIMDHKTFSIRIPIESEKKLDKLSLEENRSRNFLINKFIQEGLERESKKKGK